MNKYGFQFPLFVSSKPRCQHGRLNFNITKVVYLAKNSGGRDVNCQWLDDSPFVILNKSH